MERVESMKEPFCYYLRITCNIPQCLLLPCLFDGKTGPKFHAFCFQFHIQHVCSCIQNESKGKIMKHYQQIKWLAYCSQNRIISGSIVFVPPFQECFSQLAWLSFMMDGRKMKNIHLNELNWLIHTKIFGQFNEDVIVKFGFKEKNRKV